MANRSMQRDLWGNPIEPKPADAPAVMPIEFNGSRLRVIVKNGEPWWVLADVAKTLGYRDAANAGRLLRENQRGTHKTSTLGGSQEVTIVTEGGLYRLIMKSRSPIADEFQDWVTDEVLPAIRKTGRYGVTVDRIDRTQRQIKSDRPTAVQRVKVKDANIAIRAGVREHGGSVNDEIAIHNGTYRGLFGGHTAATLRKEMGLKDHVSPLDRMSEVCLSTTLHSKVLAARLIEEQRTPPAERGEVYKSVARGVLASTLHQLGSDRQVGLRDVPRRGTIVDVLDVAC